MKTPSISKKNRAGSPCPQPSGVSEPLLGAGAGGDLGATPGQQGDRGTPCARAWRGRAGQCHAGPAAWGWSQLRPQAGLQGPRRTGRDPHVQFTVGALGMATTHPTPSGAACGVQGVWVLWIRDSRVRA